MGSGNDSNAARQVAVDLEETADEALLERGPEPARKSSELVAATIHASPLAIIAVDEDGKIKMWNPAAERMFGWTETDVLDFPIPLTLLGFSDIAFEEVLSGADFVSLERQMEKRDGSPITVSLVSALVRDSAGRITGAVAILDDITKRKESERAFRASEERFSKAFDFNPSPMAISSLDDGRLISVNSRLLDKFGVSPDDVVGKTLFEFGHNALSEIKERAKLAFGQTGSLPATVVEMMVKGEARNILVSGEVIELEGKRCLLSAFEDVTERKRAEAEQARLQEAVQKAALEWRLTFDAVEYPVLLLDLDGRVLRLNRPAKEASGKGYWQIKGESVGSIGSGQPWKRAAEVAQSVARSRTSLSCHVRDQVPGKTWDITASLVTGIGQDDRIIMIARDITAMVDLQESLRKSETMSVMGSLVAGVAHEVRNPLFSISATLDAFEAKFGEKEEHRPYLTVLRGELDRLNQLMQDLLQYGRPAVLETVKGSVRDVVEQAVGSCGALATKANVKVSMCFGDGVPPIIMDRRRITQVFHNLIANAIQHSCDGQKVTIETAKVNQNGSDWIESSISDSGPGFAAEDLPRVFEPFFTRRAGGTGLGLSIVQRIVEEHGGKVIAGNRPAGGAVITVRFKAAQD
ncbi:MAG TPA: PAS domain S-box protein [Blastocatellia bacterium]|nr:PAS domain S-box protein [Blastocatellia bacterium]